MCFSAEASFAAGAVLIPAGGYCLGRASRCGRRYLPLAAVPLFFGLQQLAEGLVWLGLDNPTAPDTLAAALLFLFFALAFWPFWMPFSACFLTVGRWRLLCAFLAGAALGFLVFLYGPLLLEAERYLAIRQVHHSLLYDYNTLPIYDVISRPMLRLLYLLAVASPLTILAFTTPPVKVVALAYAAGTGISYLAFEHAFVSVWCFFAAVATLGLLWTFRRLPACNWPTNAYHDCAKFHVPGAGYPC